jgi:predicted Zn-dependent protease
MKFIRLHCLIALLVATNLALGACSTNPATGKRQLNVLSRAEEIQIGEDAKGELTTGYGGQVPDASVQAYVTEVGMRLVDQVEPAYEDLPWEFTFLDSEVINAFALPGGKVFITRGLAERFDSEAQLAGVLGHEVGHVTARHANEQISKKLVATGILIGVAVAAGQSDSDAVKYGVPVAVGVGTGVFLLKFGRDDELESDRLGMRYMAAAGYDPRGMLEVMQVLNEASGDRSGGGLAQITSTHPLPQTRIDRIQQRLQQDYRDSGGGIPSAVRKEEYQRRMLEPLSRLPQPEESPAEEAIEEGEGAE